MLARKQHPGLALLALVLAACSAETEVASGESEVARAETEAASAETTARLDAYRDVILAADVERVLDFWTADARVLEPGIDLGPQELESFIRAFFETGEAMALEIERLDFWLHGDVAYDIGRYEETVRMGADQEPMTVRNHYFMRWEKGSDGLWRIDRFVAGPQEAPEIP